MLTVIGLNPLLAWDPDSTISTGNEHYVKNEFELAVVAYQAVIDSGFESAELYFNLGNACFKTNQLTLALVNYERALILDPRDEEIHHNQELARSFLTDEIDVLPEFVLRQWYISIIRILGSDQWAIISLVSFITALLLFLSFLFSSRIGIRKISFWLAIALIISSGVSFGFSHKKKQIDTEHNISLILSPSVTVKSSPDESGTDIFQLHEGTRVIIIDELGDWREIKISDGNQGWVLLSDLIKI